MIGSSSAPRARRGSRRRPGSEPQAAEPTSMRGAVVGGLTFVLALAGSARAVEPGTTIDAKSVDQVKDLLPPEIYAHFDRGGHANGLVDFPDSRWQWDLGVAG